MPRYTHLSRLIGLCLVFFAGTALAAPSVTIAPSVSSGTAPLGVFFDGSSVSDPDYPRAFHTMRCDWTFDDPDSGAWELSSKSRNHAEGCVAGHLFETPGTYNVELRVTNPAGESTIRNTTISVADPDTVFAGRTRCVSSSGNFSGCPSGSERVTSSDFDSSMQRTPGRRTLYRRGDTFTQSTGISLPNAETNFGVVSTFGQGPRVIVNAQSVTGAGFTFNSGWTISGFDIRGGGNNIAMTRAGGFGVRHDTIFDMKLTDFTQCMSFNSPSDPRFPSHISVVDFECDIDPSGGRGSALFLRNERSIFMGIDIDINKAPGTEFGMRSIHTQRVVIQHSSFTGTTGARNSLQFRGCDTSWGNNICHQNNKSDFVIVSNNRFHQTSGHGNLVRICRDDNCSNTDPGTQIENFIFERNFWTLDFAGEGINGLLRGYQVEGGGITIRNEIFDFQGAPSGQQTSMVTTISGPGAYPLHTNEIWFVNNTIYLGNNHQRGVDVCGNVTGSGNQCINNLVYAPNAGGSINFGGSGWEDGGGRNLRATSNPFAEPIPGPGQTTAANFRLAPATGGLASLDDGYDFATDARGTNNFVHKDYFEECRVSTTDFGAVAIAGDSTCANAAVAAIRAPEFLP